MFRVTVDIVGPDRATSYDEADIAITPSHGVAVLANRNPDPDCNPDPDLNRNPDPNPNPNANPNPNVWCGCLN